MCGRYALIPNRRAWEEAGRDLGPDINAVLSELRGLRARYNVPPSATMPIIVQDRESRLPALREARWGYIPHWWNQERPPDKSFNARRETAAQKPMWRQAWRRARCLVPASLWYEWKRQGSQKQPYAISAEEGELMFAGLWSVWRDPVSHQEITSFGIVTQDAEDAIAHVHHRMPLILAPQLWLPWIDRSLTDLREIATALAQNDLTKLKAYRVRTLVNRPANDGPEVIEPE